MAKWCHKKYLITTFSSFFLILGVLEWILYFYKVYRSNYSFNYDENVKFNNYQTFFHYGSSIYLMIASLIQLKYFSLDPLDSGFIIYE
jgi:hypothetical protein